MADCDKDHCRYDHDAVTQVWQALGNPAYDGRHISEHVAEVVTHARALQAEQDQALKLAYIGEHRFPENTWKFRCEEAVARLREVEQEREKLAQQLIAAADRSGRLLLQLSNSIDRQRCVEAVRAMFHNSEVESARWNQAITEAVWRIESLPATNEEVGHASNES